MRKNKTILCTDSKYDEVTADFNKGKIGFLTKGKRYYVLWHNEQYFLVKDDKRNKRYARRTSFKSNAIRYILGEDDLIA